MLGMVASHDVKIVPTPSCLPAPKWSNAAVPPVGWGMAIAQFAEFVQACAATSIWQQTMLEHGHITLYKAVDSFVKPWTRGTGCGIALRMNEGGPWNAELMISHCWAECLSEAAEALHNYAAQAKLQSSVALWFCAFAQYQCGDENGDPGPTISEQLSQDPFGSVIQHVSSNLGMVVLQTSQADVYSRLWCVYEISVAVASKAKVAMTYSKSALKNRKGSFAEMLYAETSEAKCSSMEDTNIIKAKVEKSGGFELLDALIFDFRMTCFNEMLGLLEGQDRNSLQMEMLEIKSTILSAESAKFNVCAAELKQSYRNRDRALNLLFCVACPFLLLALPLILLLAPCIYVYLSWTRVSPDEAESQRRDEEEARKNERAKQRLLVCLDLIDGSDALAGTG